MGAERDKTVDELLQAREAYERRDWALALDRLRGVGNLGPKDTLALATAAYLMGDVDEAVRALQSGYQDMIKHGDDLAAVRFAFWLVLILNMRGETAVGGGWVARGRRLLETQPDRHRRTRLPASPRVLPVPRSRRFRQGSRDGRWHGRRRVADSLHPDLVAQGLMCQGRLMIYAGRVPEGLALLDEAMIGISAGEVSPIMAGMVYCSMIEACQEVSDFSRAASWTVP